MTLYIIGIGLFDEKDITFKGYEAIKKCEKIYLEFYTATLSVPVNKLEEFYGKRIEIANRDFVEQQFRKVLTEAKTQDVALLVIGDALSATTHADILIEAKKEKVNVVTIHNASVFTAVAETGLQLYKFGKTTSIPFWQDNYKPEVFYDVLKENQKAGLHTLILLDLKPEQNKYMSVNEAIKVLLEIESKRKENVFTKDTFCVGCARLGGDAKIRYGHAKDILEIDFGKPMHCLIVPAKLHFAEEEMLGMFKQNN